MYTKLSLAEIKRMFATGGIGSLSGADLSDIVATLLPDHAEITISSSAETTITDTTSYFQAAGTWALTADSAGWEMATNGQLRYTGAADRVVHATATASVVSASNNQTLYFGISKNGADITTADIHRKISTGADVGAIAMSAMTTVSTGDYLAIDVRNTTSTANMTFETGDLFVVGMPI